MRRPLTPQAEKEAAAIDAAAIRAAMAEAGNVRAAAKLLGVPRRTLDKRIVKLGLREELRDAHPYAERQPLKRRDGTVHAVVCAESLPTVELPDGAQGPGGLAGGDPR